MPDSLTDGAQRLIRMEQKLDDFIIEVRSFMVTQLDSCQRHTMRNEDEHEKIWLDIEQLKSFKWQIYGAIAIMVFVMPVISTVVAAVVINYLGI